LHRKTIRTFPTRFLATQQKARRTTHPQATPAKARSYKAGAAATACHNSGSYSTSGRPGTSGSVLSEDASNLAADPKKLANVRNAGLVDLYDRGELVPFDKVTELFNQDLT
jgi:hypothetical protein